MNIFCHCSEIIERTDEYGKYPARYFCERQISISVPAGHLFFDSTVKERCGYHLAAIAPKRIISLSVNGAPNMQSDPTTPGPYLEILRKGIAATLSEAEKLLCEWMTPEIRERILKYDMDALIAMHVDSIFQ